MQSKSDFELPTVSGHNLIILNGDNGIASNISCEENVIYINEDALDYSTKQVWLEAPTKLMLTLLAELQPQVGKKAYLKNKQKLWKVVAENLKNNGYIFTPLQVQTKFRSLERQYKKVKLNNSRTGRNRISCQYQSELENLLGDKKSINPDYVLDNEAPDGKGTKVAIEEDTCNGTNCFDCDMDHSETLNNSDEKNAKQYDNSKKLIPAKKRSTQDKALELLQNMAEEKKRYQEYVLKLLKEKDERCKNRELRSKRKLELLESIASKVLKD